MPWNTPITTHTPATKVTDELHNHYGENDVYLKERADKVDLWLDQGVKTTDSPVFSSINTGQGTNELYPMNQAVRTSDNVSFNNVTCNGTMTPTTSTTTGIWTTADNNTIISRGVYQVSFAGTGNKFITDNDIGIIMAFDGVSAPSQYGGIIFSDGINIKLLIAGGTIEYRKF